MKTTTINFPGLSLNEVRGQNKELFYDQSWYSDETFANEKIPAGNWEVSLEPVPGSTNKTWNEQIGMLGKDMEVPPAAVLAYALVEHFKQTGERCLESMRLRTSSLVSDGDHVHVGVFGGAGLFVNDHWDDSRYDNLGLASSRRVSSPTLVPTEESVALPEVIELNGQKYKKI